MSNLKWKPKGDTIGVPGKGFIKADAFSQEDLNALINRAENRNMDVNQFLLNAGLVPVKAQLEIQMEAVEPELVAEPEEEPAKEPEPKDEQPTEEQPAKRPRKVK